MSKAAVKKKNTAGGTGQKLAKSSGKRKSAKTKDVGSAKSKKKKGKRKASGKSKKGKVGKVKSKKARGKSKSGKRRPPTSQQVEAYMLYTQVRARQRSLEMYKSWIRDMVDQGRALKKELRLLEEKLYARIQNILDTTDSIAEKIRTMSATHSPCDNLQEVMRDPELESSANDSKSLQQTLRRLEEEYDRAKTQVEKHTVEGKDFKPLESETASLVQTLVERQAFHAEKLAYLQHKHDAATDLYSSRANHIIADLKRIASDQEIEQMSSLSMDVVKYNRLLRREVQNVHRERAIVMGLVQALDAENMRFIVGSAGADWNLAGVMVRQDDELEEGGEGDSESEWVSEDESGEDYHAEPRDPQDEARDAELGEERPKRSRSGLLQGIGTHQQDYKKPFATTSKSEKPPPVPRTVADLAQNREIPITSSIQERKSTRLAPLPDNTRFSAAMTRAPKKQNSSSSISSTFSSPCKVTGQPVAQNARKSPFRIAPLRHHNLEALTAESVLRAEEISRSGTRWEKTALQLEGTAVKLSEEVPTGGARFYTARFVASLHVL